MIVGCPREIKAAERRVGLSPASVRELVAHGHDVVVETTAGLGISASDDDYLSAGASIAPTADEDRVRDVAGRSSGFLYLVSLVGVTGARDRLPVELEAFVSRVRAAADLPLAVGFGIGTPEQAGRVARIADGVIVGSAVIRSLAAEDPVASASAFVRELREGIDT